MMSGWSVYDAVQEGLKFEVVVVVFVVVVAE